MAYNPNNVLSDVALVLIDPPVNTTLGTAVVAGTRIVTPPDMTGIYVGAMLIAGTGVIQEVVTVTATTATTFTATFTNSHTAVDVLFGATFPAGQTVKPLFTQVEMLGYLVDAQNDFLLRTQCVIGTEPIPLLTSKRFYDAPSTAIRIERISVSGSPLYDASQTDLDLEDPTWMNNPASSVTHWYQDQANASKFGVKPIPSVGATANSWFSKRGPTSLTLLTAMTVPDIFYHYMKYAVLARCFSKDGEMRDPLRAEYCDRRYKFGVNLAIKFMEGLQPGLRTQVPVAAAFNPMVIPQLTPDQAAPADDTGGAQ